jgi:hypothetical protein
VPARKPALSSDCLNRDTLPLEVVGLHSSDVQARNKVYARAMQAVPLFVHPTSLRRKSVMSSPSPPLEAMPALSPLSAEMDFIECPAYNCHSLDGIVYLRKHLQAPQIALAFADDPC